jgi:hypothetical protein
MVSATFGFLRRKKLIGNVSLRQKIWFINHNHHFYALLTIWELLDGTGKNHNSIFFLFAIFCSYHSFTNVSLSLSFLYAFLFLVFSCSIFCLFLFLYFFIRSTYFHILLHDFSFHSHLTLFLSKRDRQLVIKLLTQTKKCFQRKLQPLIEDWKVQNKMSDKIKKATSK